MFQRSTGQHRADPRSWPRRIGQLFAALFAACLVVSLGGLSSAFAAGTPVGPDSVPVTATIPSSTSLTLNTASMDLSGNAGTTSTGSISYNAQSNDAAGAQVITWVNGAFRDGSGYQIPEGDLSINPSGNPGSQPVANAIGSAVISDNETGIFNDNETDAYALNIPAAATAGTYSGWNANYEEIPN